MQLQLDIEGGPSFTSFPNDGADLVAFMSFAVSRGFGAIHPLIALADRLHDVHGVSLGPLTTFYETEPEDGEDREKLELAWQAASGLLASLEGVSAAFETDPRATALIARANAGALPGQVAALLEPVRHAAAASRRVRLTYTL